MQFNITLKDGKRHAIGGDSVVVRDHSIIVYSDNTAVGYFFGVASCVSYEHAKDMPITTLADKEDDQGPYNYIPAAPPESWKTPVVDLPTGRDESRDPIPGCLCNSCQELRLENAKD